MLALAFAAPAPAARASSCGWQGYSYAGVMGARGATGIGATISTIAPEAVQSGHVAAWVGLSGAVRGAETWIQAGVGLLRPGRRVLYYEFARAGAEPRLVELQRGRAAAGSHQLKVLELRGRPGWWQVVLDGRPAGRPVDLEGSHGALRPIATGESWNDGRPACNTFGYRFEDVVFNGRSGAWAPLLPSGVVLQDPGYRLLALSGAGFSAVSAAS